MLTWHLFTNDPTVLFEQNGQTVLLQTQCLISELVDKLMRCERPSDLEVPGHSLRVGAAQDLLIKGHDLAAIMRAGGSSNAETASRYLQFSQHNI